MMLPENAKIVGIVFCHFDAQEGILRVQLALDDGSTCASYWDESSLKRFMKVISGPTRRPVGEVLQ